MINKNITRAIWVALIVGSLLNLINSYDILWDQGLTTKNLVRIWLTYIIPFFVSLYSSANASKAS